MSAPNILSEQDLLAQIQRELENNSKGNDKTPKIKVGDQEYSLENAQAIQDAINNSLNRNQTEFETLRAQVEELNRGKVIKPELDEKPPVTQQQPRPIDTRKPRNLSNEEWTTEFVKDPQRVFDETLARMLGVEGSGREVLQGMLAGIGQELQNSQLERKALLAKAQELDQKIGASEAEKNAQRFIDKNPDYEVNDQNQQIMQKYLADYGLPATEKNLTLIFNQAIADGKIKRAESTETQQNQQLTQPPLRQGVPRLSGRSQGAPQDENYILEQANKLPVEEHYALIQRLRNGQFQR